MTIGCALELAIAWLCFGGGYWLCFRVGNWLCFRAGNWMCFRSGNWLCLRGSKWLCFRGARQLVGPVRWSFFMLLLSTPLRFMSLYLYSKFYVFISHENVENCIMYANPYNNHYCLLYIVMSHTAILGFNYQHSEYVIKFRYIRANHDYH